MKLRVSTLVPTTQAEGPGLRFSIWVQGCSIKCPGCCNPGMFAPSGGEEKDVDEVFRLIEWWQKRAPLEGVSILGGEPFEQDEALAVLCKRVQEEFVLSVMVFTGYELEDERVQRSPLMKRDARCIHCKGTGISSSPALPECVCCFGVGLVPYVDLLKVGPYKRELATTKIRWIGSTNQRLIFNSPRYTPNDPRFKEPNHVEIKLDHKGELSVVGFPFEKVMREFPNVKRI